jgi:glycosyltransferase involved in cell wall biosynthesis
LTSLRILAVVAKGLLPRVVMSAPLPDPDTLAWWDRALLRRVRCLDLPFEQATQAPHRVKGPSAVSIVCIGDLERESGFREAIWTFDILLLLYTDAQLQIVGAGSQQSALQAIVQGLQNEGNVQFLGLREDTSDVLAGADIVWIPSLANGGRQVALEAMALGRAVVASDVPCLREIIRDGETGFLVPPGDAVALARRTHALLQDVCLRGRIGAAARQSVATQFSLSHAVERWREAYQSIGA